jgi:guanine deaminase
MEQRFLERAVRIACESVSSGGGPFGCVVTRDDEILAESGNRVTLDHDPTAHAEVLAIRAACRSLGSHQLQGCDVYCSCEPCPMCLGAIYWSRPRAVFFAASREDAARAGFDDALIYAELSLAPDRRQRALVQAAVRDADEPFRLWRGLSRRVDY